MRLRPFRFLVLTVCSAAISLEVPASEALPVLWRSAGSQDRSGAVPDDGVDGVPDPVPPVFVCAVGEFDRSTVVLTFDEELETDPLLSPANEPLAYSLVEAGGGELLGFATAVVTNGNQVLLTLEPGQTWKPFKSYRVEIASGWVTDLSGNPIEAPDNTRPLLQTRDVLYLDSVWEFDQSGVDLGTAWLSNDAPAFAMSGPGILGHETSGPAASLIRTDLAAPAEGGPNGHYFRTWFGIQSASTVKRLVAGYYVDDQAVIYLNGVEVHRTRAGGGAPIPGVPGEPVPYGTQPGGSVGDASLVDGIELPADALVEGRNALQVYVAQAGAISEDVVWGMTLRAVGGGFSFGDFSGLPSSTVLAEGESFNLNPAAGRFLFQWLKDGVPIVGATNMSFGIAAVVPGDAGLYELMISGESGQPPFIGGPFALTVICDCTEPPVIDGLRVGGGRTSVILTLSEPITEPSAIDPANYSIQRISDGSAVAITGIEFDPADPAVVVLNTLPLLETVAHTLTVVGLTDRSQAGNRMLQTAVVIPAFVPLLGTGQVWRYDQRNVDLGTEWREPVYDDSAWPAGPSLFGFGVNQDIATLLQQRYSDGLSVTNAEETSTYYFRTRFWSPWVLQPGDMLIANVDYDDAFVMYLNGVEVARAGILEAGTNLHHFVLGSEHGSGVHEPFQLDVEALLPGGNVLAVELHQGSIGSVDLALDVILEPHATDLILHLCAPADPEIVSNGDGTVTITWSGGGELWAAPEPSGAYVATGGASPYTVVVGGMGGERYFQVVCPE